MTKMSWVRMKTTTQHGQKDCIKDILLCKVNETVNILGLKKRCLFALFWQTQNMGKKDLLFFFWYSISKCSNKMLHFFFFNNCPQKSFLTYNPLSTPGLTLILSLSMPKNAHTWMVLQFFYINRLKKKKKGKQILLSQYFASVRKLQTNIFILGLYSICIFNKCSSKMLHFFFKITVPKRFFLNIQSPFNTRINFNSESQHAQECTHMNGIAFLLH